MNIFFIKLIVHLIFRPRYTQNKFIKKFAKKVKNKKILEIGSGKEINGKYIYSVKIFFDESNEFIQSDINPTFNHKITDVTKMKFKNEFDIILCLNVLEHVFNFKTAIQNIYRSLKKDGIAIFSVPAFYPLHDIPNDYWRFSEYSLKKLFKKFSYYKIEIFGLKMYPTMYIARCIKR